MIHAICWRDHGEKERCAKSVRNIITAFSEMPAEDVFRNLKNYLPRSIFGSPEELIETIHSYAKAGADEIILEWFLLDDIEGLQVLAEDGVPQFKK